MKKRYSLPLLLLFFCVGRAQTPVVKDSVKYQKFKSSLIVGVYQSYRNFENTFKQTKQEDSIGASHQDYMAESRLVAGVEVIFDKFGFSLGLRSNPQNQSAGKGATQTLNANLNFGGNIWYFQNSLRYFKGFYDANTATYDTTFRETGRYYQRADMENILLRSKFLYFTNHRKYASRACYAGNYRQVKSAATWILSANVSIWRLFSDSSFFSYAARPYYGGYSTMNDLGVLGLSANVGAAGTLVIMKGFFLNGMFIVGPEQQWRTYKYLDGTSSSLSYISISGDLRFSIGVNLKRCYFLAFNTNDFSIYNSSFVGLTSSSISGGFTFGWRFKVKIPEAYKKFQETKFYKAI